jgi:hypothetical protein
VTAVFGDQQTCCSCMAWRACTAQLRLNGLSGPSPAVAVPE